MSSPADAIVVGGGLAGSAVAIALAREGRAVTLIEKSKAAHPKVCGEFLSHEALHYLARLGLDGERLAALGAWPIEGVRLATERVLASAQLPFPALSLSRECLDEELLRQAVAAGVRVERGDRVQALARRGSAWSVATVGGACFKAGAAFLATGKHDLHGFARPAGKQSGLLAFKMYWQLAGGQQEELGRTVELVLYPGGYTGLQLVEQGRANLCLLIEQEVYRRIGSSWPALLEHVQHHAHHLRHRLAGAEPLWERPLSLSSIPYGYVRSGASDGLWRLGDQSAVIPSFSGDGMSIALHSACLAADVFENAGTAADYQRRLARSVSRHVSLATLLSRALVRTPRLASLVAERWPGLLPGIARSTRIRARELLD